MGFKEARLNARKTILDVAHAMNVSPQAVYQWENGETAPSTSKLTKLAEFYGCSVDKLLEKGGKTWNTKAEST